MYMNRNKVTDTLDEIIIAFLEYCCSSLQSELDVSRSYVALKSSESRIAYLISFLSDNDDCSIFFHNHVITGKLYALIESWFANEVVECDAYLKLISIVDEIANILKNNDHILVKQVVDKVILLKRNVNILNGNLVDKSDNDKNQIIVDEVNDSDKTFIKVAELFRKSVSVKNIDIKEIDDILNDLNLKSLWYARRGLVKRILDIQADTACTENYKYSLISYDKYIDDEIEDVYQCCNDDTLYYHSFNLTVDGLIIMYKLKRIYLMFKSTGGRCFKLLFDLLDPFVSLLRDCSKMNS